MATAAGALYSARKAKSISRLRTELSLIGSIAEAIAANPDEYNNAAMDLTVAIARCEAELRFIESM
jgi:hypothetical protein